MLTLSYHLHSCFYVIIFSVFQYIGSFSVSGEDQASRTEFVQQQLDRMHVSLQRNSHNLSETKKKDSIVIDFASILFSV